MACIFTNHISVTFHNIRVKKFVEIYKLNFIWTCISKNNICISYVHHMYIIRKSYGSYTAYDMQDSSWCQKALRTNDQPLSIFSARPPQCWTNSTSGWILQVREYQLYTLSEFKIDIRLKSFVSDLVVWPDAIEYFDPFDHLEAQSILWLLNRSIP